MIQLYDIAQDTFREATQADFDSTQRQVILSGIAMHCIAALHELYREVTVNGGPAFNSPEQFLEIALKRERTKSEISLKRHLQGIAPPK